MLPHTAEQGHHFAGQKHICLQGWRARRPGWNFTSTMGCCKMFLSKGTPPPSRRAQVGVVVGLCVASTLIPEWVNLALESVPAFRILRTEFAGHQGESRKFERFKYCYQRCVSWQVCFATLSHILPLLQIIVKHNGFTVTVVEHASKPCR